MGRNNNSNVPTLGTARQFKCSTPGPRRSIKIPPYALPLPHRLDVDRCINFSSLILDVILFLYSPKSRSQARILIYCHWAILIRGNENKAYILKVGSVKIPVYSHMTSVGLGACGGGGWTLVMKTDSTKVYLLRIQSDTLQDLRQITQNTRKSVSRL